MNIFFTLKFSTVEPFYTWLRGGNEIYTAKRGARYKEVHVLAFCKVDWSKELSFCSGFAYKYLERCNT